MKVLLVEPWWGGSHRSWAEGYANASGHDVTVVHAPATAWRWRLRGGAAGLAREVGDAVGRSGHPDVLLVSGLVDVSQLLGFARRTLRPATPVVIYQHESQLVYPTASGSYDAEAALRNWQSWCAADHVVFNSGFHRSAVEAALPSFLAGLPEPDQLDLLPSVVERFAVVPVGIESALVRVKASAAAADRPEPDRPAAGGPLVLWPHRWEPDKDPAAFTAALRRLRRKGLDVRLLLAGEDPPHGPNPRTELLAEFSDWVEATGPFTRSRYLELVERADIVVSCAHHEFFGVGVAEAVAAGCRPVLPRALSYPELIDARWHDLALYDRASYDRAGFGTALEGAVAQWYDGFVPPPGLATSMGRFTWQSVAPLLDATLDRAHPHDSAGGN